MKSTLFKYYAAPVLLALAAFSLTVVLLPARPLQPPRTDAVVKLDRVEVVASRKAFVAEALAEAERSDARRAQVRRRG
ncbi:MAG TPA: hypothetical protein VFK82_12675 [Burkholderiaceae bacterium]|nr:hypothetical protein [Burkholderiaceae bacterium]